MTKLFKNISPYGGINNISTPSEHPPVLETEINEYESKDSNLKRVRFQKDIADAYSMKDSNGNVRVLSSGSKIKQGIGSGGMMNWGDSLLSSKKEVSKKRGRPSIYSHINY